MERNQELGPIISGAIVRTENTFKAISPADGSELGRVFVCGEAEVDAAVRSSETAFVSWGKSTFGERADRLDQIADILKGDLDWFAENETLDTGKGIGESRLHVNNCINMYRYFASVIRTHEDTFIRYDSGSASIVVREPLGVVGLILPWNAPSMLLSWKLAPALAAGNCAVVKPASAASMVIINMALRFQEALPPGVLNVVTGSGETVGNALAGHPGIRKISFTGSSAAGSAVGAIAGRNIIPVTLELGGKSASVIFEDANLDRALQYAILPIASSAGQICVSSSRLLVQDSIYDAFTKRLKAKFDGLRVGDPMDLETQVGPVIDKTQFDKVMGYIDGGIAAGAKLLSGGKRVTGGICDKGFYIAPTLFGGVTPDMAIAGEEIFGPVLSVLRFSTEEDAVRIANGTQYGLGAAVWTKDIYRAMRVSHALEAGTVWVNDYLDNGAGSPFGGYKKSGVGRELNKIVIDYYSNIKNISVANVDEAPPIF